MLDSMTTSTLDSPFTTTGTSNAASPEAERLADREAPSTNVRVLHVINGEHYSGAERVQDLLAARLPEFGFDAGFACVKPDRFPDQRQTQEVPLFELPMRRRTDLRVAWQLRDVIRRHDYAIVHAHTVRSALVARIAAKLAGVPFVYHVHSPASRDTTRRWRNWVNDRVERFSLTGAQRLITVSHSLAQHMQA
ncbi:MAG: glycosyltransferase, partial [Planctomycetales bacterium]|nr:glycosyltransferase [Planctomycetales bacterium]